MVPLGQVFDKLARVVRQISRELTKEIRLVITGAETEIDKLIVEELSDPLMHMIRNAIDHGIEPAEQRSACGKPAAGTIALNAFQKGNHVVIEVEDDGRGIDEQAAARRRPCSSASSTPDEARELSRDEILDLIFLPGLSARAAKPGDCQRPRRRHGRRQDQHQQARRRDRRPQRAGHRHQDHDHAADHARDHQRADRARAASRRSRSRSPPCRRRSRSTAPACACVDGREVMTLRGATLPLCRLDRLLGLERRRRARPRQRRFVVVASLGNRRLGLVVDHLIGQQDIVIKPLGARCARVRGFAGATELGDQRVGLVLDAAALIEEVLAGVERQAQRGSRTHG